MNKLLIEKYARLAVEQGVNVQPGQNLIIQASVDAIDMVRACTKIGYERGAKQVIVFYQDEVKNSLDYLYQKEEDLCHVYDWQVNCKLDYFKEGACILHIISEIPDVYKDCDPKKIANASKAARNAMKEVRDYTMSNKAQWSIVAVPNVTWAKKVFPDLDDEKAVEALWKAILKCVHVDENNDPIAEWNKLQEAFDAHLKVMNEYQFKTLHFTNALGTDLYLDLVDNHVWAGGCDKSTLGFAFNANMPTEEIFCMPAKYGVNGVVYASLPLSYNGVLVKDFWIRFEDGKAVEFDAKEGKEALSELISFDEGSAYLGEVALVPYDSPISQSKILFYNTLFDENASCHLALGDSYCQNVANGLNMNEEELKACGANSSNAHVDFMFGTSDMSVVGITKNQKEVAIFVNGNFTF